MALLGGERQLLNGEQKPDGERQRLQDAIDAEGIERAVAVRQFDRRSIRPNADVEREMVVIEDPERRDEEEDQDRHGDEGDGHSELERQFDAPDIEANEHDEHDDPPHPL